MRQLKRSKLELRGLLIGMWLGDANLSKVTSRQNSRLLIGHSTKQKDYCEYKLKLVSNLLRIEYSAKEYNVFNKKTNKEYNIYQGSTRVHRYLTKLRSMLYDSTGTKVITDKVLNYLTLEGLAFWFQDDGGVAFNNKRKAINGLYISTQNFTYDEHLTIRRYFKTKYDIECKIHNHGKKRYRIFFNKTNSKKFLSIIEKFKHDTFVYKFTLNYKDYVNLTRTEENI
jgi:hypothetical protein